jgi:steroid delta-isomerase-like uncharacterized protein
MTQNSKTISRRFFEEILSKGDLELVNELFTADYNAHTPIGVFEGIEGARQFVIRLREAFPDLDAKVEDQVVEGDKIANLWSAQGTHQGDFGGIPATGRKMETSGITMFRIADGKVLESWGFADLMGMMKQLGAAPTTNP